MQRLVVASLLLATVVVVALEGEGSPPVIPGRNWVRHTPDQEGMDNAKVQAAMDWVGRSGGNTETYCTAVVRNGYLIGDKYWSGHNYNKTDIIWSVSKAYMATLIGTAERDRKLNTSELMGKYIPEWARDSKTSGIQMEHVMRHNSGRYYDPVNDFVTPQTKTDQTAFAISLSQQFPPGTKDQYNQMAYQTLQQVYERATGLGIQAGAQRDLYGPMQFESKTFFQMNGFFTGVPQKNPLVYGGVTTSCADMARFGLLWLNKGAWGNHTVFTRDFYNKAMTRPQYPYGLGREFGNWGTTDDGYRSIGLGKQMVMFNAVNGIVLSRIGGVASIGFDYNEYFKMIRAAIKNPELRGRDEDWVFVHNHGDEELVKHMN